MKLTIIFCFLLVLINSKQEFEPLFAKAKSFLQNSYSSDSLKANEYCKSETKDECLAETIPNEYAQCCYINAIAPDGNYDYCSFYLKDIKGFENILNTKAYKAYLRETNGLQYEGENVKYETTMNCNNGKLTINNDYEYNEDEKKILTSKKHCLDKYNSKLSNYTYDVGKCEDGLLLDSSKKDGLECGYSLFNIKINSKKTITYKTCILFNFEMNYNLFKLSPDGQRNEVERIIKEQKYESFESYTFEQYNTKGKKIKYDSKNDKIIIQDNGFMLTASKYLLLLILILL